MPLLINLLSGAEKTFSSPGLYFKDLEVARFLNLPATECMQILYVLSGIRPGTRITINESLLDYIQKIYSSLGLHVLRSDFYVEPKIIRGAHFTYLKSFKRKRKKENVFIYLSFDKKLCNTLKDSEARSDDFEFGKSLGYPKCCVEHYVKQSFLKPGDFFMNSFRYPTFTAYPYLNNAGLWVDDFNIIPHYPCRPDCKRSLEVAEKYAQALKKWDRKYFDFIEKQLKSIVICSREGGVIYSTDYSKTGAGIRVNEIKGDPSDPLYKLVKKSGQLNIDNPARIKIRSKWLSWPETKVVIFN